MKLAVVYLVEIYKCSRQYYEYLKSEPFQRSQLALCDWAGRNGPDDAF